MDDNPGGEPGRKASAAKRAARLTWRATRKTGKVVRGGAKVTRKGMSGVKTSTAWLGTRVLGTNKYRRDVDDVVGRLSDALRRVEAALTVRDEEIRRLREELEHRPPLEEGL